MNRDWYMNTYRNMNKDELIEEIFREKEHNNVRRSIEVDSQWISKYKEINKNCYLLSEDLVKENEYLKEEVNRLETILERMENKDEKEND